MSDAGESASPKKPKMVDWYAPGQLIQTGIAAGMSAMLGAQIDSRRIIAFSGSEEDSVVDYSGKAGFSFDYLADTGDGWDSTYTMAYLMTTPSLEVGGETLERPDVAILGGDMVYPVASKEAYAQRLVWPFNEAPRRIREDPEIRQLPHRDLFMVPGNHDWYDSLGSMTRRFFASRSGGELKTRPLGQFRIRQVRSYFVLKLPANWEVWAVDIQLGRDIDPQQYAFFRSHAETVGPETRIVFCTAEPTIVYGESVEARKADLVFGLKRIRKLAYNRGARVLVQLAGDTHNHQHYLVQKKDKNQAHYERHHFVSGGGGAFLHPNHGYPRGTAEHPSQEPLARYPDEKRSKRLSWRNLGFAFAHKGMSALVGVLYALMFWGSGPTRDWGSYLVEHLGSALLAVVVVAGTTVFAGKGKYWWGLLHGLAHVGLAVLCWRLAEAAPFSIPWLAEALQTRLLVVLLGGILGGTLFGVYLLLSLNVLRIHQNEAFSSLAWAHDKSFLRCTVEADGSLTIRAIGVPRIKSVDDAHPVPVELIEKVNIGP